MKSKEAESDEPSVKSSIGPLEGEVTAKGVRFGAKGGVPITKSAGAEVSSEIQLEGKRGQPNDIYPDGAPYVESHVEVKATFKTPTTGGRAEAELKMASKPQVVPLFDKRPEGERLQKTLDAADPDGFSKPRSSLAAALDQPPAPKLKPFKARPMVSDPAIVFTRADGIESPSEWLQKIGNLKTEFINLGRPLEMTFNESELRIRDSGLDGADLKRIEKYFRNFPDLGHQKWQPPSRQEPAKETAQNQPESSSAGQNNPLSAEAAAEISAKLANGEGEMQRYRDEMPYLKQNKAKDRYEANLESGRYWKGYAEYLLVHVHNLPADSREGALHLKAVCESFLVQFQ